MIYRAYITKDYKAVIRRETEHPFLTRLTRSSLLVLLLVAPWLLLGMKAPELSPVPAQKPVTSPVIAPEQLPTTTIPIIDEHEVIQVVYQPEAENLEPYDTDFSELAELNDANDEQLTEPTWENITVVSGDSLARIFKRLNLSAQDLDAIMTLGEETSILKYLQPDQIIQFQIEEDQFKALRYPVDMETTLLVTKADDGFHTETLAEELDTRVRHASVTISDSLFLSGVAAGLSDNLIMQLVAIYGWDIDFALDIRSGDHFTMIYQEQYKKGKKVGEGPILAVEFINQNSPYRAVRYTDEDGHSDYYSETGQSMRKAFLRTPVNFTRISSLFNLKRKHPILNKVRAHRGVDYAAPSGTPVKATGDGTVIAMDWNGGLGKSIILKHGGQYSTVYGHLSGYKKGLRKGARVKQGQIIGYVGTTGLSTGPHLHYEFRINGVHRNPLKVDLPKAVGIPKEKLDQFIMQIKPLLAELDNIKIETGVITVNSEGGTPNPVL